MATNGDLARRLLGAAQDDELAARSVLRVEGIAGVKFQFTHDLGVLRQQSKESGIALPTALDDVEDLNPFASDERYGAETPIGLDRDQALKWAAATIAWARGIVEQPDTLPAADQDTPAG